jgi:hypothetical protein
MKNLKYLQVFEAFESKTLSKVFNYVNKNQKGHFKDILLNLCDKLKFPLSKLSDDLFQYLPFNKALHLTHNIEDNSCDNESDTIPGEKCSGPTGDENQGTIMRTWGKGKRRVECPVCKGTGIQQTSNPPIKWIKFWFDKDGKYITTTMTDGKIRIRYSGSYSGGLLDADIDNYKILKSDISVQELREYETGDIFKFTDSNNSGTGVAMLFKDNDKNYMIQNWANGSQPDYSRDWKKIARYSWVCLSSSDVRGKLSLLIPKKTSDMELKKPDPYTWNAEINLRNLSVNNSQREKETLQPAHFALILDYAKMKEKTSESDYISTNIIKDSRKESRMGSLALKLPNKIREENYERYMETISKNLTITSDIKNIRNIFNRTLGMQYAGHYILQGLHFNQLEETFERIIKFIQNLDSKNQDPQSDSDQIQQIYIDRITSGVRKSMDRSIENNNNIRKNLDNLYKNSPSPEHTKIVDKFVKINTIIINKIKTAELDSIEDAVVLNSKIIRMNKEYKESPLFAKARRAWDIIFYIEDDDKNRCLRYLKSIEIGEIDGILSNFDQYIKYINKL